MSSFHGNCTAACYISFSLPLFNVLFLMFLAAFHGHSCWAVGFSCFWVSSTFCNYFAAKFFLPLSSPPHFLSCSPVTLINFWPVDSAWVLLPKCAAIAAAAAVSSPHFFVLSICWFLLHMSIPILLLPPPLYFLKMKTCSKSIECHFSRVFYTSRNVYTKRFFPRTFFWNHSTNLSLEVAV